MAASNFSTPGDETGGLYSVEPRSAMRGSLLQAPALALEFEQVSVVHEAVEQRCGHKNIAELLRPVIEGMVRGDDGGEFLVATHEHVGEFIAGVWQKLAQEQIVDHQQLGGLELGGQLADFAEFTGFVDILDQLMGRGCKEFWVD